ncbi:hypothetical protein OC835_007871 [Tilletia horrida]|nr:hypothetical protein OC835_007871 [Tilletia horrida]
MSFCEERPENAEHPESLNQGRTEEASPSAIKSKGEAGNKNAAFNELLNGLSIRQLFDLYDLVRYKLVTVPCPESSCSRNKEIDEGTDQIRDYQQTAFIRCGMPTAAFRIQCKSCGTKVYKRDFVQWIKCLDPVGRGWLGHVDILKLQPPPVDSRHHGSATQMTEADSETPVHQATRSSRRLADLRGVRPSEDSNDALDGDEDSDDEGDSNNQEYDLSSDTSGDEDWCEGMGMKTRFNNAGRHDINKITYDYGSGTLRFCGSRIAFTYNLTAAAKGLRCSSSFDRGEDRLISAN